MLLCLILAIWMCCSVLQRSLQTGGIIDRESVHIRANTLVQAGEHLARSQFKDSINARSRKLLNSGNPGDWIINLIDQITPEDHRVLGTGQTVVMNHRNGRSHNLDLCQHLSELLRSRLHQGGMEWSTDRKWQCAFGTGRFAKLTGFVDSGLVARDHY